MAAPKKNRRVLVVDDDPVSRESLRESLAEAGYDVEGVSTDAGLTPDLLELFRPGLVLVDESLGGPTARRAMEAVLEGKRRTGARALLMGAEGESMLTRARELGLDGHIEKWKLRADPDAALATKATPPPLPRELPKPPPLPVRMKPPPPSGEILAMIDEELSQAADTPGPATPSFDLAIDLFSEHNFYLAKTATGQQLGIFVATALPPLVGSRVQVKLRMPGGHTISTPGEVVWIRPRPVLNGRLPAGAGVRMLEITETDKAAVRGFIGQRTPYAFSGT